MLRTGQVLVLLTFSTNHVVRNIDFCNRTQAIYLSKIIYHTKMQRYVVISINDKVPRFVVSEKHVKNMPCLVRNECPVRNAYKCHIINE